MDSFETYQLTPQELVILAFSIFAAYPRLYWQDNSVWFGMWAECQKVLIECKMEQR